MIQVHAALDFVRSGASHEQLDNYLRSCLGNRRRDDLATSSERTDGKAGPADDSSIPGIAHELISDVDKVKEPSLASDQLTVHSSHSSVDADKYLLMEAPVRK